MTFNQFHELFDGYANVKQVMVSSLSWPGKSLCPEIGPSSIEIMLPSGAHLWQKPWMPKRLQVNPSDLSWWIQRRIRRYRIEDMKV